MAANVKRLGTPEEVRDKLTEKRLKKIRKMYMEVYIETSKKIENTGDRMKKRTLEKVREDVVQKWESINEEIEKNIRTDMHDMSVAVIEEKRETLQRYGFKVSDVEKAFYYVPAMVVKSIANGTVYQKDWTLSDAIWSADKKIQDQLGYIISKGVASGKSTYEIALDLEKYVLPSAKKKNRVIDFQVYKRDSKGNILKDDNGNPIPDGRKKHFYFGSVDYNASRLARTMISHAYQQSFERVNKNDPFIDYYIWHASGQHGRTCPICLDRDGQHFKKDDLPLDHPNGMCTFEPHVSMSDAELDKKMLDWYHAPFGTYPDIDAYAAQFLKSEWRT